ncbi:hypothetical protein BKA69DRAFT_1096627 [Paraphysoderma sedebokerense]|nr:hypothetical protein BKA69DRAFT_1096627 [Paraphysoderma sedebokerense]
MFLKIGIALLWLLFATNIIYGNAAVSFVPVDLKFSSYVWEPGQDIEATVTTGNFQTIKHPVPVKFVFDIFSNEKIAPKFKFLKKSRNLKYQRKAPPRFWFRRVE